jgi:hypothetical protein
MLEEKNKIKSKALFIHLKLNLSMWVFQQTCDGFLGNSVWNTYTVVNKGHDAMCVNNGEKVGLPLYRIIQLKVSSLRYNW